MLYLLYNKNEWNPFVGHGDKLNEWNKERQQRRKNATENTEEISADKITKKKKKTQFTIIIHERNENENRIWWLRCFSFGVSVRIVICFFFGLFLSENKLIVSLV